MNSRQDDRQQGRGFRITTAAVTGILAGLTRAVADALWHRLTTGR